MRYICVLSLFLLFFPFPIYSDASDYKTLFDFFYDSDLSELAEIYDSSKKIDKNKLASLIKEHKELLGSIIKSIDIDDFLDHKKCDSFRKPEFSRYRKNISGLLMVARVYSENGDFEKSVLFLKFIFVSNRILVNDGFERKFSDIYLSPLLKHFLSMESNIQALRETAKLFTYKSRKLTADDLAGIGDLTKFLENYFDSYPDVFLSNVKNIEDLCEMLEEKIRTKNFKDIFKTVKNGELKRISGDEEEAKIKYIREAEKELKKLAQVLKKFSGKNYLEIHKNLMRVDKAIASGKFMKNLIARSSLPNFFKSKDIEQKMKLWSNALILSLKLREKMIFSGNYSLKEIDMKNFKNPFTGKKLEFRFHGDENIIFSKGYSKFSLKELHKKISGPFFYKYSAFVLSLENGFLNR